MYYLNSHKFTFVSSIKLQGFSDSYIKKSNPLIDINFYKTLTSSIDKSNTKFESNHITVFDKSDNLYKIYKDKIEIYYAGILDVEIISSFLISLPIGYFYFLNNYHVIHGSCISFMEQAVSFIGKSGAGKSSLAALLCDSNFKIYSEDLTILNKNMEVFQISNMIKLSSEIHDILDIKFNKQSNYQDLRGRSIFQTDTYNSSLRPLLKKCYILKWTSKTKTNIYKIEPIEVFKNLITFSYGTLDEKNISKSFEDKMNFINKIVTSTDFYILEQPKNLNNSIENANQIKEHIINS